MKPRAIDIRLLKQHILKEKGMHLFIAPHPPIILAEIGRGEEIKAMATIEGMQKIADDIAKIKPKTIAVVTPHGNAFSDALCVNADEKLQGDFAQFGKPSLSFSFAGSTMTQELCEKFKKSGVNAVYLDKPTARQFHISTKVDHGALVPLSFIIKKYSDFKLIHIGMGMLDKQKLHSAGRALAEFLDEDDVIIISGDLSHRLIPAAPAGYDELGVVYDGIIVEAVKNDRFIDILTITESMLNRAGQCAQRPLEMMIGVLDGHVTESHVYSYEGPYGVGYMTAHILRKGRSDVSVYDDYFEGDAKNIEKIKSKEDEYVSIARKTIDTFILEGKVISIPNGLSEELYNDRHGVFVSIKKSGALRGCIGTIEPVYGCVAEEIVKNAISAATRDPRFNPITEAELVSLEISVDVLFPAEDISGMDELDPKRYGVIVSRGFRRGLLLPNLEGIDDTQEQVSIALQKAGISPSENYKMQRFEVVRHR